MRSRIAEAFGVLGLEQGSSLELVKSTYKQIALRTHPNKNPDNLSATAEFQHVSEAYRVLLKYLDRPAEDEYGDYDDDDDYPSDFDYSEDEVDLDLYMLLYEVLIRGERHPYLDRSRTSAKKEKGKKETQEQYETRIRCAREEQVAAQRRREQETAARKARVGREREQERIAAEERQKAKVLSKKAEALSQRQKAEQTIRLRQQRIQAARSAVFSAARRGDTSQVEKGVWEDEVDAAGGEVKDGCDDFVKDPPQDTQETLMHIAAKRGDQDLVKWLDGHGAEPEERDVAGFSPFHVALQHRRVTVAAYFFEIYPPGDDTMLIYDPPQSITLLALALGSGEPELVWMILDKGLATTEHIEDAWNWALTRTESLTITASSIDLEKFEDIKQLLMRFGGYTLSPSTQPLNLDSEHRESLRKSTEHQPQKKSEANQTSHSIPPGRARSCARGRGHGRGRGFNVASPAAR